MPILRTRRLPRSGPPDFVFAFAMFVFALVRGISRGGFAGAARGENRRALWRERRG